MTQLMLLLLLLMGAAESATFKNTLGKLKPASSLIKLGDLAPPPQSPDVSHEPPTLTPPSASPPPAAPPSPSPQQRAPVDFESPLEESVAPEIREEAPPEVISVTPGIDNQPEVPVDVRPLRAEVWRGELPLVPAGRTSAAADSDSERSDAAGEPTPDQPFNNVLRRILNSLPGGPASRDGHGQEKNAARGHFFGTAPPQPPHLPPRPPFHQPPAHQHPPPQHLQPGQPGFHHLPQTDLHFDPPHLGGTPQHGHPPHHGSTQHGRPANQRPSHLEQLHQQQFHDNVLHHGSPSHQSAHIPTTADIHSSHRPVVAKCGRGATGAGLLARITRQRGEHGVTAYGEYPWHVGVLSSELRYLCAGALVAPRLALTVAHCVAPLPAGAPLLVRAGDWDLASDAEFHPAYDVEVVRAVVHPEYYAGNLQNDLALLLLDPPVEGLPHVQPACLPPPGAPFDHQRCWVTGWGQARPVAGDAHDAGSYSWQLREATVTVETADSCERRLRATHLGPFFRLARRGVLCATGRRGDDSCFGDGGGALVCPLPEDGPDGPLYVAGLVSWGIGCGQDIPAVYTKVSDYHGWIRAVLDDLEGSVQFPYAREHAGEPAR